MTITATSQTVLAAAIVALALIGLGLLLAHHVALEARDRWAHRRTLEVHRVGIELCRARTAAHEARKRSTVAHDEDYAAQCRAERDKAHRLAVQLLHRNDELEAELAEVQRDRDAARDFGRRLERDRFALATFAIELDQTQPLPVLPPAEPTTRIATVHHRRRSVLAPA